MVVAMLTMVAICAGAGDGDAYIGRSYNTLEAFPNAFKVLIFSPLTSNLLT